MKLESKPKWMLWIPDALAIAGSACVTCGSFLISVPLGWIVAGGCLIAGAIVWSKGVAG